MCNNSKIKDEKRTNFLLGINIIKREFWSSALLLANLTKATKPGKGSNAVRFIVCFVGPDVILVEVFYLSNK